MPTMLNPYLSFRNNCREAMEFYQSVFGGKTELHTFKEFNAAKDPSEDNLIMHSMLTSDNGIVFMGADTPASMEYKAGNNFSMSLSGDNQTELTDYFNKLSAGGMVMMPLEKAQWGDMFGMFTDKFGVQWMVNITMPKA